MENRINKLLARLDEVEALMSKNETLEDKKLYRELTQEYSYLSELKDVWHHYQKINNQLIENEDLLLTEKDPGLIEIIKEEIVALGRQAELTKSRLQTILVPPDPHDSRNIILEMRAGTGGEEAALFVTDLARMYTNYADRMGWVVDKLSSMPSDMGGYKEYIIGITGPNVHRYMQYEGGGHRVQRVPETEASGRLHTSAATVAVLLEPDENDDIDINDKDLQIDTYRASGAGGQHVNTTDSAVRITHIPTNTVVCCQDERSQHKNKDRAMRLLKAKIAEEMRRKQSKQRADLRASQVGSGDRSERIRTYNFPQNRITDHRIDLTLYQLDQVLEGNLDPITNALVAYYYQQKMTS